MLPFNKILFPIDYSQRCREVVPYVEEMTNRFSGQLSVVHAFTNTDWLPAVDEEEKRRINEFVAEAFPGRHVDAFLEEGEPGSAIEKVVRHQGADLVMMPTHGAGLRRRLLLGSVTAKVLHDVSAAVWTEGAMASHAKNHAYRSILCAVTFGEDTEASLRAAALMASRYQAGLSLIHVVDPAYPTSTASKEADEKFATWKQKLGIDAPHCVRAGRISDVVCDEAARQKADLLVVGRGQSQGILSRMWSHLYEIVRESPCPVLSV
jgi:nucleotide-binding universal stress UspA family protein